MSPSVAPTRWIPCATKAAARWGRRRRLRGARRTGRPGRPGRGCRRRSPATAGAGGPRELGVFRGTRRIAGLGGLAASGGWLPARRRALDQAPGPLDWHAESPRPRRRSPAEALAHPLDPPARAVPRSTARRPIEIAAIKMALPTRSNARGDPDAGQRGHGDACGRREHAVREQVRRLQLRRDGRGPPAAGVPREQGPSRHLARRPPRRQQDHHRVGRRRRPNPGRGRHVRGARTQKEPQRHVVAGDLDDLEGHDQRQPPGGLPEHVEDLVRPGAPHEHADEGEPDRRQRDLAQAPSGLGSHAALAGGRRRGALMPFVRAAAVPPRRRARAGDARRAEGLDVAVDHCFGLGDEGARLREEDERPSSSARVRGYCAGS